MRRQGHLRAPPEGAGAYPGRRGAGVRHVLLCPGLAWGVHRPSGSLLCRDSVRTLERDLHSGTYGGVAPNAIETWCGFWPSSSPRTARSGFPASTRRSSRPPRPSSIPGTSSPSIGRIFSGSEVTGKELTGLEDRTVFERVWALPTFEIHGIKGGFIGEGAKTVIPAQATAKVSLRLVPGQELREGRSRPSNVRSLRLAPEWAEVKVTLLHGGDPVQVDVTHPAFAVLDEAFEAVVGRSAVQVRAGGSIPIVPRARPGRGSRHPDRHRSSRRWAPLAQREARSPSALERDRNLWPVLRAICGKGRAEGLLLFLGRDPP